MSEAERDVVRAVRVATEADEDSCLAAVRKVRGRVKVGPRFRLRWQHAAVDEVRAALDAGGWVR